MSSSVQKTDFPHASLKMTKFQFKIAQSQNTLQKWFFKWDRIFAGVLAIIIFFILLALVIYNIIICGHCDGEIAVVQNDALSIEVKSEDNTTECVRNGDTVQCSGAYETLFTSINTLAVQFPEGTINQLQLTAVIFPEKLNDTFLTGVNLRFKELLLDNTLYGTELQDGVFGGSVFTTCKTLTLSNTGLSLFFHDVFQGSYIDTVQIRFDTFSAIVMVQDFFKSLNTSLVTLQIQNAISTNDLLVNITGSGAATPLRTLLVLDIRSNLIEVLTNDSFTMVPNLQQLFASGSNIQRIEQGTFYLQTFSTLQIQRNHLSTLPKGTFTRQGFMGSNATAISGNKWACDCELLWLKEFYTTNPGFLADEFLCNGVDYTLVEFCEEGTTKVPEPSTSLPALTTSEPEGLYVTFPCVKAEKITFVSSDYTISLRRSTVLIDLVKADTGTSYIEFSVSATGNVTEQDVLLYVTGNHTEPLGGCVSDIADKKSGTMDLTFGETYLFCLVAWNKTEVNPLDCKGFTAPLSWNQQAFITNNSKLYSILGVSLSFLLVIVLSCLFTFCCVWKHPSLIKKNKNVVIIKGNKKSKSSVNPTPYYAQVPYVEPSISFQSEGSYLTARHRNLYQGSVNTISQCVAGPSHVDSLSRGRIKGKRRGTEEEHIYEPPPVLPPNHPKYLKKTYSLSSSVV